MINYKLNNCGMKLLVDNPEPTVLSTNQQFYPNSFEQVFAPWPLRFYIIVDSKIVSFVILLFFSLNLIFYKKKLGLDIRTKWWNV